MSYNPCYCWDLKDGCITVGIWSLLWSIMHLGLFGWQTWVIRRKLELESNRQGRMSSPYNNNYYNPGYPDWTQYYVPPGETKFTGIFCIQIINMIAAFFLAFASCSLIYGIYTNSKHLVWPWFPCIAASTLGSAIYCLLWWTGNVESYWLVITVVEFASVIVNIYCILCVSVQYKDILNGYVRQDRNEIKSRKLVYEYVAPTERYGEPGYDGYKPKNFNHIGIKEDRSVRASNGELIPTLDELRRLYSTRQDSRQKRDESQRNGGGGPSEFKSKFTEAWINEVNNEEPNLDAHDRTRLCDQGRQLDRDEESKRLRSRRTKSADVLQQLNDNNDLRSCKSKDSVASTKSHRHRHCYRHHHHCRRRRCRRCDLDDDDVDDASASSDDVTNSRCSQKIRHARSCSSYRSLRSNAGCSDSDTGYSASSFAVSETDVDTTDDNPKRRRRCKHHCCKHAKNSATSVRNDGENPERPQNLRPRAVKRYDKARQRKEDKMVADVEEQKSGPKMTPGCSNMIQIPVLEGVTRAPAGGVPVLPHPRFGNRAPTNSMQPATISIPQRIVIPGALMTDTENNDLMPQKYRVNSEIVINCCDGSADIFTKDQQKWSGRHDGGPSQIKINSSESSRYSPGPWVSIQGQQSKLNKMEPINSNSAGTGRSVEPKRYTSTAV